LKTIESDTPPTSWRTLRAGKTMGKTAQEVREILAGVPSSLQDENRFTDSIPAISFRRAYEHHCVEAAFTAVLDEF